jgi:alpha-L-arabinofuranosidase
MNLKFKDMILDFETKLERKDITTYGNDHAFSRPDHTKNHEDAEVTEMIIKWQIEIETRSWGVKDISAYIKEWSFLVESDDLDVTGDPRDILSGDTEEYSSLNKEDAAKFTVEIEDVNNDLDNAMSAICSAEIDFNLNTIIING